MPSLRTNALGRSHAPTDPDLIERQILHAYVELAAVPKQPDGVRTTLLARLGALEMRLTELPHVGEDLLGMPSFWLEVHSYATGTTLGSYGASSSMKPSSPLQSISFVQCAQCHTDRNCSVRYRTIRARPRGGCGTGAAGPESCKGAKESGTTKAGTNPSHGPPPSRAARENRSISSIFLQRFCAIGGMSQLCDGQHCV
ncbi:hypothetical protein ACVWXL_000509 [Bradyrhizobium sp. GM22.5]